jgi:hypothetical protein
VSAVLLCLALTACVLGAGGALVAAGSRAGDRPGDSLVTAVSADATGRFLRFSVHNPADGAVLVGASVRRPTVRLRLEAGAYVGVPRRTDDRAFLAGRYAHVCALDAHATESLSLALDPQAPRRAELVVAIGQADRLRLIHRVLDLPAWRAGDQPEAPTAAGLARR